MRIRLTLQLVNRRQNLLPINYNYELSSWIYKTIYHSNAAFADFLHSNGYMLGGKRFKLFTFSQLLVPNGNCYFEKPDRLRINSAQVHLVLSLCIPAVAEHFITGIFHEQTFSIGDQYSKVPFRVLNIEALAQPTWQPSKVYRFRCLSPICISQGRKATQQQAKYCSPEADADIYPQLFFNNLSNKYLALQQHKKEVGNKQLAPLKTKQPEDPNVGFDFGFKLLSTPKSKLIQIKSNSKYPIKVRGYTYDFELTAPPELLHIGYMAGMGEKNSTGFGCVEMLK